MLQKIYDKFASVRLLNQNKYKHLVEWKNVLELGCWHWRFWKFIKKYLKPKNLIGIDIFYLMETENLKFYKNYKVVDLKNIYNEIENIIKTEKINLVMLPYMCHHILDDKIIEKYLDIFSKNKVDVIVYEEVILGKNVFSKKLTRFWLIFNDIVSNIFSYKNKLPNFKEFFWLNFKTINEWKTFFSRFNYDVDTIDFKIRWDMFVPTAIFYLKYRK